MPAIPLPNAGAAPPLPAGAGLAPAPAAQPQASGQLIQPATVAIPVELAQHAALIGQLADSPDASAANAATLIVGDTGSGKTNLLATGVEYTWEIFQMMTRIYAGDPGGFGTKIQSLMRLGICEVWRLRNHNEAFETAERASHGWWPETIDKATGLAAPDARLIPPTITQYVMACPHGHEVQKTLNRRQLSPQLVCPAPGCGTVVNATNWTISERTLRTPGTKRVGLYCFESLSSWSAWVMNDMADRSGRDELGGEKGAINKIVSGDLVLGANNRAHYGFAQNRAEQWVINSAKIPGAVMPPIWTALELRASDEGGLPIYGPKIAGKAKTDEVPSWFGNCLHAEKMKDQRGIDTHRLWLVTHTHQSEGNIPHLAKHRSDPSLMPQFLEDPINADGTRVPFSGFSLNVFFRQLGMALSQNVRKDAAKYTNAPIFQEAPALDVEEAEAAALLAGSRQQGPVMPAQPQGSQVPGFPSGGIPAAYGQRPMPPPMQTQAPPAALAAVPPVPPVPPVAAVIAHPAPDPSVIAAQLRASLDAVKAAQTPAAPVPQPSLLPPPSVAAAAPAAPPQSTAPTTLPPPQPVAVSGPASAPVRPPTASAPPPPPPGTARPTTRRPPPAVPIPPAGGPAK